METQKLRKRILQKLRENGIEKMHGLNQEEIVDSFTEYTTEGRQLILDWYGQLAPNKSGKMNFIRKTGFEHQYFYIGGTHAAVALLLLGFKVNERREANIYVNDMKRLNDLALKGFDRISWYGYTEDQDREIQRRTGGLSFSDINSMW